MNSDERGYVTVEHAIGFLAVTAVIGLFRVECGWRHLGLLR